MLNHMKSASSGKNLIYIFAICVFTLFVINDADAQVPKKISYQGLLTTPAGTPVPDGSYDLTFKIFDVSAGGSALWTEIQTGIPVQRGTFNVFLGSVTTLNISFNQTLYVEVTATSGPGISSPVTLSPRSELTSSPYAMRADTANFAAAAGLIVGVAGGDLTGTYPNPTIATGVVNSAKIFDGSIGAVDIRDTTIVTAKIKDAAVTTEKIAADAVTNCQKVYRTDYNSWNKSSSWQSIPYMNITITTTGRPVLILYSGGGFSHTYSTDQDPHELDIGIFRGTTLIATTRGCAEYYDPNNYGAGNIFIQYLDTPAAGMHTYSIKLLWNRREIVLYQNVATPYNGSNSLTVIEFKR